MKWEKKEVYYNYKIAILNIKIKVFQKKIEKLGAKKIRANYFRKCNYISYKDRKSIVTLSTNGVKTMLLIDVCNTKKNMAKKIEFNAEQFDKMSQMLGLMGYYMDNYQESLKVTYLLGDIEISINNWPNIPKYIQIQGKTKEDVYKLIEELKIPKENLYTSKVSKIYEKYGKEMERFYELKLKDKRAELRDLYNEKREKTGETIYKWENIPSGRYITTVICFIQNSKGEFLVQRTSIRKDGLYASTGGHPKSGESSIQGIITEIKEELGLRLQPKDVKLFYTDKDDRAFCDLYYIKKDVNLKELVLEREEVYSVEWATEGQIKQWNEKGEFRKSHYEAFEHCLEYLKNKKKN